MTRRKYPLGNRILFFESFHGVLSQGTERTPYQCFTNPCPGESREDQRTWIQSRPVGFFSKYILQPTPGILLLILLFVSFLPVHAQVQGRFLGNFSSGSTNHVTLPDSSQARIKLLNIIDSPLSEIKVPYTEIIEDPFMAQRVRFRIEEDRTRGYTYLIFENETIEGNSSSFPLVTAGNMIIRRTHQGGAIDQIKYFLGQGAYVYLRFYPMGQNQTRVSFFAYNDEIPLIEDMILAVPLRRIITLPTAELISLMSGNQQWRNFLQPRALYDYEELQSMVDILRPLLDNLPDNNRGVMDQSEKLVSLPMTLPEMLPGFGVPGFVKWVTDGVFYQYTGSYIRVEDLLVKHLDLRGSAIGIEFEEIRHPYFTLDWSRNLGQYLAQARFDDSVHPEDMDVREVPFFDYIEDIGYRVPELWQIMYLLALTEPGHWYLGSINGEIGSNPVLWQHFFVAAFFPYFDSQGVFRVAVMERNTETGIDSLIRRYPNRFIHLTRMSAPDTDFFRLPVIQIQEELP